MINSINSDMHSHAGAMGTSKGLIRLLSKRMDKLFSVEEAMGIFGG